mmetsp:Transcript_47728/g.102315  ORF Transcript_47728/g.102315 Transcript_47728/m.102315 type:complete len:207 (-) Transcript_47728:157-777(-)
MVSGKDIVEVGVEKINVQRKVTILDVTLPVKRGRQPPVAVPCVRHGLVPTLVEVVAAIVMVTQDAHPRCPQEIWAVVDAFKDRVPLAGMDHVAHVRLPTICFVAPRVEVVSHVQQERRVTRLGDVFHHRCDFHLGAVVDALHEGALLLGVVEWLWWVERPHAAPIADCEEVSLGLPAVIDAQCGPPDAIQRRRLVSRGRIRLGAAR